jgi:hypothetical protein
MSVLVAADAPLTFAGAALVHLCVERPGGEVLPRARVDLPTGGLYIGQP